MTHRFNALKCGEFLCLVPQRFCPSYAEKLITQADNKDKSSSCYCPLEHRVFMKQCQKTVSNYCLDFCPRSFSVFQLLPLIIILQLLFGQPLLCCPWRNCKLVSLWQWNFFFGVYLICFHLCSLICTATDISCPSTVFHWRYC